MDISSFSTLGSSSNLSQNSKLLEAFEKMTTSTGSDLKSSGPMGEPDAALVKEFEMALQGIDPESVSVSENRNTVGDVNESQSVSIQENQNLIQEDALHIPNQDDTLKTDLLDNRHSSSDLDTIESHGIDNSHSIHENSINQIERTNQTNQANSPDDILKELDGIMKKIGQGNINSSDLYRAQYITAMFSTHVTSGNKVSQQAAQGIESVLKQQ